MSEQPTLRAHLDQAGEEIVAGNPFRALGHINSALSLLDEAEAVQDGHWLNPLPVPMRFRYVLDPLSCPEVPAETRDGETT